MWKSWFPTDVSSDSIPVMILLYFLCFSPFYSLATVIILFIDSDVEMCTTLTHPYKLDVFFCYTLYFLSWNQMKTLRQSLTIHWHSKPQYFLCCLCTNLIHWSLHLTKKWKKNEQMSPSKHPETTLIDCFIACGGDQEIKLKSTNSQEVGISLFRLKETGTKNKRERRLAIRLSKRWKWL